MLNDKSQQPLDLLREAIDAFGLVADRTNGLHRKWLHATRNLVFYEMNKAEKENLA